MKAIFKTTIFLLFLTLTLNYAQGYSQGGKTLNIGAGIGLVGLEGDATIPPISVGMQLGLTDKISIGGIVGYAGSSYKFGFLTTSYEWKYSYIIVGARGEYHFMKPEDKLDLYTGVTLGYNIVSVTEPDNLPQYGISYSATSSSLLYGGHAGARYAFSNSFGLFVEVGYGIGYITGGVFLRM
ncbi:MAG: porin family protein [Melioribacter sp.]|nr:porin family protein [Melioribacter sp.]